MGAVTESFGNLSDYLLAERKSTKGRHIEPELILSRHIRPLLPSAVRCGSGLVVDIKDRQVGPLDVIACIDAYPPFSEGAAAVYPADGVVFALQVRNWSENDLIQFGEMAALLKGLQVKRKIPIPCLAVSFEPLSLLELTEFLNSKTGQSLDGVLCIGHHVILRNSLGWYGDPAQVPFVTERPGPEALKSFTFFLLQLAQTALGQPFGLAEYQHL